MTLNRFNTALELLSSTAEYPVAELGQQVGLAPTILQQLLDDATIQGVPLRQTAPGIYSLTLRPNQRLAQSKIMSHIDSNNGTYLDKLILLQSITSTNTYLLNLPKGERHKAVACLAEHQSAGRGRSNKTWVSPYGTNIYLSLAFPFQGTAEKLSCLSIAVATTVLNTILAVTDHQRPDETLFGIKWPNDLVWKQKKIAGILVESLIYNHNKVWCVVGIGINLEMPYGTNINQEWADLSQIFSQLPDRNHLAGLLINNLLSTVAVFQQSGLAPFMEHWQRFDITQSVPITVTNPQGIATSGIGGGIDLDGSLILLLPHNSGSKKFKCGNVSLRVG